MTDRAALRALARAYGVQTAYRDGEGRRHSASPEALVATLEALGALDQGEAGEALAAEHRRAWAQLVEPVVVAWDGWLDGIEIRRPQGGRGTRVHCQVTCEGGTTLSRERRIADLVSVERTHIGRAAFVRHQVPLDLQLPLGYHDLEVVVGGQVGRARVLAAPRTAWLPDESRREWGLFVPAHALGRRGGWGCGDYTDLATVARQVGAAGGRLVGTLPLLPLFLDVPFDPSPYAPVSRRFWSEFYVDVTRVPELAASPAARRLLASDRFRRELGQLRRAPRVDYARQHRLRSAVLERLSAGLERGPVARREAFDAFLRARPDVMDYARFRALGERQRAPWPAWPVRLRAGRVRAADVPDARVRHHAYVQWIASQQIDDVHEGTAHHGAGLYLDLPLGVHADGYDPWRERSLFVRGASLGAPPDPVFRGGQDWGIPPLHPRALRESGHAHLIAVLRHHMRVAEVLRIDHVMGLHRQFWVPRGHGASAGMYVAQPAEEFYAVACLESQRQRCALVGEDLGTVPAAVRRTMARHGVLRMYVAQYELVAPAPQLAPPPVRAVASLGTHDMPTFTAFWNGTDIGADAGSAPARRQRARARRALAAAVRRLGVPVRVGTGAPAPVVPALRALARSRAWLVLVALEDLLGATEPQNRPGTPAAAGNWSARITWPIERVLARPEVRDALASIGADRRQPPALLRRVGRRRR